LAWQPARISLAETIAALMDQPFGLSACGGVEEIGAQEANGQARANWRRSNAVGLAGRRHRSRDPTQRNARLGFGDDARFSAMPPERRVLNSPAGTSEIGEAATSPARKSVPAS